MLYIIHIRLKQEAISIISNSTAVVNALLNVSTITVKTEACQVKRTQWGLQTNLYKEVLVGTGDLIIQCSLNKNLIRLQPTLVQVIFKPQLHQFLGISVSFDKETLLGSDQIF